MVKDRVRIIHKKETVELIVDVPEDMSIDEIVKRLNPSNSIFAAGQGEWEFTSLESYDETTVGVVYGRSNTPDALPHEYI